MADHGRLMAEKKKTDKRYNRFVGLEQAANSVLDPVFRKRGFANRDLFARWAEIAPPPFDRTTLPERLFWPRSADGAEGAILVLRCQPGAALAVAHEGARIAEAVNFYFGYFLVRGVKLSAEPFVQKPVADPAPPECPPEIRTEVDKTVADVSDDALREALRHLGENIKARRP